MFYGVGILMLYWILAYGWLKHTRPLYRVVERTDENNGIDYVVQYRLPGEFTWHDMGGCYISKQAAMDRMQYHIEYDDKLHIKITKKEVIK